MEAELKLAKEDFNTIRYKLTVNNAEKDKTIDQLYNQLRSLESKQIELKSELSDATDRIKSTKQSKEEQIAALEKLLQKTSNERDTFRKELSSIQGKLEFENQKLKSQIETLTGAAEGKEDEIAKLKAKNEEINAKLRQIQKSKSATDAEIKKLTNQVNLLKKELAK